MYGLLFLFFQSLCFSLASQLENLKNKYGVVDIDIPHLEFADDSLKLFGDFDALTFPQYEGQENFSGKITDDTDSRGIVYYSNDTFIKLINGSSDTYVENIVPFDSDCFILGGSGQLMGYELDKQLLYNLSDLSLRPIFENSLTTVNSILEDYPLVYFGGNFTFSNGSAVGNSVVVWNSSVNTTSLLPFGGFGEQSVVNSIIKLDPDNILFVGKFDKLDNQSMLSINSSQSNNTETIEVNQIVPLQMATWNTDSTGSFDSSSFICPDSQKTAWSVPSTTGSLECSLPYEVFPKKLRIYNSPEENSGISLFRIITKPSNGIMNMTYVDPSSGELSHCDAFCPLLDRDSLEAAAANSNSTKVVRIDNNLTDVQWSNDYQDFAFVNEIEVTDIQFLALSSYGNAVGLSSFELYQGTFATYANNSLNDFTCESNGAMSASSLSDNGWQQVEPGKSYLAADFKSDQGTIPKVTFNPVINYAGQYTINFYTPGCQSDNTCTSRSIVNVTVWAESGGSVLSSMLLYQNNEAMKYDQIYSGHLESSPVVTMEFYSSIFPNNPISVVVADRVEVVVSSIDMLKNHTEGELSLNGLFQYQISNFTGGNISSAPVGNSSLNYYAVENFPENATLFSSIYNSTLWVGGSVSGVATIALSEDLSLSSTARYATGGTVEGISTYADGIILFGAFNLSSQPVSTLTYNGAFNSFGNLNTDIKTFNNISLGTEELLVFNNDYFFNLSSNNYISNTSSFGISLWSAGRNLFNDTLFSGALAKNQFADLKGSASIYSNASVDDFTLQDEVWPYAAYHLNETVDVYAYLNESMSHVLFDNGEVGPWTWFDTIKVIRYSNNDTILAVGTNGSLNGPSISVLNLTTLAVIANTTLTENSDINSMIFFDKNSTLLVGGDYYVSDVDCHGLCLYNYDQRQWTNFANGSVTGNVTEMQLSQSYDLLISGVLKVGNRTSTNLVSLNMSSYETTPLVWGSPEPLRSFIVKGNDIIAWNDTTLLSYRDSNWEAVDLGPSALSSVIDVTAVGLDSALKRRQSSSSVFEAILVAGRNSANNSQASIYDFENWSQYYFADVANGGDTSKMAFFTNEDDSQLYDSRNFISNPTKTTTASSSSVSSSQPSPSKSSSVRKNGKINRGFVVLIGLALALGTVLIIGITGVLLALVFGHSSGYEQVDPRADESEMIDTVPPEKLLKFL